MNRHRGVSGDDDSYTSQGPDAPRLMLDCPHNGFLTGLRNDLKSV